MTTRTAEIHSSAYAGAFYVWGLDGFDDLFDWTRVTVDALLRNRAVEQIVITHPNVDYERFPGDRVALAKLKTSARPEVAFSS